MAEDGEITEAHLAKIRRRLQGLLSMATKGDTEEERAHAWELADKLAQQYRIDLAIVDGLSGQNRRSPIRREIDVDYNYEFYSQMYNLVRDIFLHYGCRVKMEGRKAIVIGFSDELGMAEMLYTSAQLTFIDCLMPKWETHRSFDSNVFRLKTAGRTWMDIVHASPWELGLSGKSGSKLRAAYRRECERLGAQPPAKHTLRPTAYRQSYADAFVGTLKSRLSASTRKVHEDAAKANSKLLPALRAGEALVEEAFYEEFPDLKPRTEEEQAAFWRDYEAKADAEEREEQERRAALTDEERAKQDRDRQREETRQARNYQRWEHRNRKDEQGWQSGYEAANRVDIGGSGKVSDTGIRKELG